MGSIERRERAREEMRLRILDAARELFVEQGFEAVTMRKIAARIEYTATALYFHFKDKNALVRALCTEDFVRLREKFAGLEKVEDPIERLRRIGYGYISFAVENPNQYRFMFMTPLPAIPDPELEHGKPEQDAYTVLRAHVQHALDQGCIRDDLGDSDLVAQTLWAGMHGVAALHIARGTDDWPEWRSLKKRVKAMVDVLVRGIIASDRRRERPRIVKRQR